MCSSASNQNMELTKKTVSRYTRAGSHVFALFLDGTKAFDRAHHLKLFGILLESGVPNCAIRKLSSETATSNTVSGGEIHSLHPSESETTSAKKERSQL